MSAIMMDEYHAAHAHLQDSKKWKLKNGDYAEDIIYKYGSGCDHQHPVHSYILDIDDPIWAREFSEEQLEEISSAERSALPELSDGVKNIFKVCSDMVKPFIPTSASAVTSAIDETTLCDNVNPMSTYIHCNSWSWFF
ncbi:hypothetical protein BJV82DRAFT_598155 [Fennellomyces sp. T-0311]|nr:hypothetical protein BJV82DRAFT_598155 [Fennellomyces sp. T-0311]